MLTLKLEVVELVRRLPANPLPMAEAYSAFEADGSFSSIGGGPSGLHPLSHPGCRWTIPSLRVFNSNWSFSR